VITYVNPLVAVLLGIVLLSEPFTLGIAVGMPLILIGSVLATSRSPQTPEGAAPGDGDQLEDELAADPYAP
jgi:drug/metabolite transporter (DMT)-like permease